MLVCNLTTGSLDLCTVSRVLRADDQGCQVIFLLTSIVLGPKSESGHDLLNRVIYVPSLQFYYHIHQVSF